MTPSAPKNEIKVPNLRRSDCFSAPKAPKKIWIILPLLIGFLAKNSAEKHTHFGTPPLPFLGHPSERGVKWTFVKLEFFFQDYIFFEKHLKNFPKHHKILQNVYLRAKIFFEYNNFTGVCQIETKSPFPPPPLRFDTFHQLYLCLPNGCSSNRFEAFAR